jgi:hypothetical protein
VEIHVTDDRLGGYFRRYQLALRMMAHGARAQTVMGWSGLTRDQLVTQRRRWGFDTESRQRGPAPRAFHVFFKSRRHRSEATLFASICRIVGATPAQAGDTVAGRLPSLENGELLCEAFEVYKEWQPGATLEFEHAVLLAIGVVNGTTVALGRCSHCSSAVLIDRTETHRTGCGRCNRSARGEPKGSKVEDHGTRAFAVSE